MGEDNCAVPKKDNYAVPQKRVQINGCEVSYLDTDPKNASKPTLFLIHGWNGYKERFFEKQIAQGLQHHFRCIVPDLPGHGDSPAPNQDPKISGYVETLSTLIDQLGLPKVHLLGESMGGMVAQEFMYKFPKKVDKCVLWMTSPGLKHSSLYHRCIELLIKIAPFAQRFRFNSLISLIPPSVARRTFGISTSRRQIQNLAGRDPIVFSTLKAALNFSSLDYVFEIQNECLVIGDPNDRATSLRHSKTLHRLLPNSQLKIITDSGHLFTEDGISTAVDAVIEFLGNS